MQLIFGILFAGMPFVVVEVFSRFIYVKPEVSRKLVHIGSALQSALLPLIVSLHQIVVIALLFALFFAALRSNKLWNSLYRIERRTIGEISFPLGVAITAAIAPNTSIYIVSLLLLGIMDPLAAYMGMKYGKRKMPIFASKTIVGSASALVGGSVVAVVAGAYLGLEWRIAIALGACGAFAEAVATFGLDNITIPLVVSAVGRLLS